MTTRTPGSDRPAVPAYPPALLPRPRQMATDSGNLPLDASTTAAGPQPALDRLREVLRLPLPEHRDPVLRLELDDSIPSEGYRLVVDGRRARLSGGDDAGLLNGVHTIAQLVPSRVLAGGRATALPRVRISDRPRFAWRGVLLDVARHFMPVPFILRLLDLICLHRLNVLHLHLTDDQGWRLEIPRYPRLTTVGAAARANHPGGWYTAADIHTIVAYAARRGVFVVPEIEMPGHVQAAVAAYPDLGNHPERPVPVWDAWGVSEHILNVEESTVNFFRHVLTETARLFPGPYLHIGGDECPFTQWRESPAAQERMRTLGFTGEHQLYTWFMRRLAGHVTALGRRPVCWSETGAAAPPGAVVMPWREVDGAFPLGQEAGRAHDTVMVPHQYTYLDYRQSDRTDEPVAQQAVTTLADVYSFQPWVPSPGEPGRTLGVQCALWTEFMPTTDHVEYMAFPRLSAFAEIAWGSPRDGFTEFVGRLRGHLGRLDALGVQYRPLDQIEEYGR